MGRPRNKISNETIEGVLQMRREGYGYQSIGNHFRIQASRVKQILIEHGVTDHLPKGRRTKHGDLPHVPTGEPIEIEYATYTNDIMELRQQGLSKYNIARQLCIPYNAVNTILKLNNMPDYNPGRHYSGKPTVKS